MLTILVVALLGQAGGAETAPPSPPHGSDWSGLPGESASPVPEAPAAAPAAPAPPVAPAPAPILPMPPTIEEPLGNQLPLSPRQEPPNLISLYGAAPLGPWHRAGAVALGFPLLSARLLMGVTPKLDVGVEYDTLYGLMHDVRAAGRWSLLAGDNLSLGVVADARARRSTRGRRASTSTGRGGSPGGGTTTRPEGWCCRCRGLRPGRSRFFLSARCLLAMDTAPLQSEPLGGTPPPVLVSANLVTEVGLEAPVSEWVALAFRVGLDLHGRSDDSLVMVTGSAGVVTALP